MLSVISCALVTMSSVCFIGGMYILKAGGENHRGKLWSYYIHDWRNDGHSKKKTYSWWCIAKCFSIIWRIGYYHFDNKNGGK